MPLPYPYPYTNQAPDRSLWPAFSKVLAELYAHKWLFPLVGTCAVVIFFWRIRYIPSLTLTDIGLVAIAIVMFSLLMIVVVAVALMLPAAVLIEWQRSGFITDRNSARTSTTQWMAPIGLSLGLLILGEGLALGVMYLWMFTPLGDSYPVLFVGTTLIGAAGTFFPMGMKFKSIDDSSGSRGLKGRKIGWAARLLALSASLYLLTLPIFALVLFGTHTAAARMSGWEVIAVSLALPVLHFTILSLRALPVRSRLVALGVLLLYFLLFAGTVFESLDRAASTFQLGFLADQSVVVSSEGCRLAQASAVVSDCRKLPGPGKPLYEIRNVQLLNRLGSHTVIAEPGWTPRARGRSVPLPSTEVLTWYATPPIKVMETPVRQPAATTPATLTPPAPAAKAEINTAPKPRRWQRAPAC